MKAAIALVDELLMGPAANDTKVRQSLVKLRQLLSEPDERLTPQPRRARSRLRDQVASTKKELAGSTVSGYERSSEGDEEYLNEMRPGHPPFRVSKRVFLSALRVMMDARQAMTFEEWRTAMLRALDEKELPEYLLRVIIRFLRSRGMLAKNGVRYGPTREHVIDFDSAAEAIWSEL